MKLRVFISSEMRSGRLRRERLAVASVVEAHPDAEPWLWERHARAGRYSSFEVCVGTAKTSDILLLILADELTDVTEAEWRAAKAGGANCALLVKDGPRRTSRAGAFIAGERRDCIYVGYCDLPGLRRAVQGALTQCTTDAVRHRALARRVRDAGNGPVRMHLLEAGIERADHFYRCGSISEANEVLAEVEALLGPHDERPEDLDLISGLVAGAGGDLSRAATAYLRIIRNKRSSKRATAIAYQNLGIEAMRAEQLKLAAKYMRSALRRHQAADDWFGVLQVLLNMANLAMKPGETERAGTLADLAEELVPLFDPPVHHQRASVVGLRALIAASDGRHDEALGGFKKTHAIFRRLGDLDGTIVGCQNIAASYHDLGHPTLARRWIASALALAGGHGTAWRREELHRLAALIEISAGRLPEAREHFEHARAVAAQMGDSWRVATLTADIGAVLAELDDEDASTELERARDLLEAEQDFDWLVRVGMNRALVAARAGDHAAAQKILEEMTGLAKASRSLRTGAHERLAELHLEQRQLAAAARNLKRAFELQTRTPESAITVGLYAHMLQNAGDHKRALTLFDLAVSRARMGDDEGLILDARSDRALLLAAMGDEAQALSELDACLDEAKLCRDPERTVRALHNIGELARRTGDIAWSLTVLREACRVAARSGDEEAHRSAMGVLGITQVAAGRIGDAKRSATSLREKAKAAKDRANESVALGVLGSCAFSRGDYQGAAALYRAAAHRNADDPVHMPKTSPGSLRRMRQPIDGAQRCELRRDSSRTRKRTDARTWHGAPCCVPPGGTWTGANRVGRAS